MSRLTVFSFLGIFVIAVASLTALSLAVASILGWAELLNAPVWAVVLGTGVLFFQVKGTDSETGLPLHYGLISTDSIRAILGTVFTLAAPVYLVLIGINTMVALALFLPFGILNALHQAGYKPFLFISNQIFNAIQPESPGLGILDERKSVIRPR